MGESFTHRERLLIRHLTSLVAQRAEAEAAAAERLKEESYRISRAFEKESKQLNAEHAREQADSAAELTEKAGKVRAKADEEVAAARKAMDTEIGAHNARTNAIWKAAKGKWDEAVWLADTVVESGGSKIRNQYELAKRGLTPKVQDVERIRRAAMELLESHGHKPLPDIPPSDESTPVSIADFNASRADAVRALQTLHSRVRPVVVRWPLVLLIAIIAAAAGAAIRIGWPLPDPVPLNDAAVTAGASAIGAAIVMLLARLLLRKRVPRAAAATAAVLERARHHGEACLNAAERHRDEEMAAMLARRDADLNKAKEALALARAEVDKRIQVEAVDLKKGHENRISVLEQRRDERIASLEEEHAQRLRAAQWRFDQSLTAATQSRNRALAELNDDVEARLTHAAHVWKSGLEDVYEEVGSITTSPEGSEPVWKSGEYAPPLESPSAVRFGQLSIDMSTFPGGLSTQERMAPPGPTTLDIPSFLDLTAKASLLVQSGREDREPAIAVLRMVMSRLLTGFPPGKVRFTIVDPIGLGRSFAGFMHLADHEPALVSDRIWTDPRHIEQKLTDLTEHMENVIQKYLRNEYATIQEYNAQAGEVAEPYRFLVIADFPVNLTENAAKKLWSIITSGARCGVYTLIAESLNREVPSYVPLADLERSSVRLVRRQDRFVWQEDDFANWPLTLDEAPDDESLTRLLNKVGALSKDATRVQVPFEMIAPADGLWPGDASEELRLPIGRAGAKKLQNFSVGRGTTQHALIAGRTGSGKSTLLHVIITNLALWYSPDEVEMYLVDFKKGVEFKTYATHRLPHARVVAVESEREFGLSVLRKLDAELTRRGALFRECGAQDLAGYRRSGGGNGSGGAAHKSLPRILLIVDEFQEFFVEDDKIAQEASLLLDRLVRQGRAFGMHVILGSQTLGGAYSIARATIGQMAVRIALQCSESDAYLIMSEENAAPRLLSRPGEAIYNDASGLMEGNSPFQIVWLPEPKREKYLEAVRAEVARTRRTEPPEPVVFEGNIPAQIASNHLLDRLIHAGPEPSVSPRAWLGDAISIKDPTAAVFQRQSGSNLLIVGQQEESALALLVTSIISLASHGSGAKSKGAARIVILDGSPVEPSQATSLESLARNLPSTTFSGIRSAPKQVSDIYTLLESRTASDSTHHEPVYLIIYSLHRFRDLRKSDDFSYSSSEDQTKTPAQQFAAILRDGPSLGIHVLAWTDTVSNVERTLERNSLKEFDSRVLFQMSATDSTQLIDSPAAATLGRYRALLYREQLGVPEKFRPYAMPDQTWLDAAAQAIRDRITTATSTGQTAS